MNPINEASRLIPTAAAHRRRRHRPRPLVHDRMSICMGSIRQRQPPSQKPTAPKRSRRPQSSHDYLTSASRRVMILSMTPKFKASCASKKVSLQKYT